MAQESAKADRILSEIQHLLRLKKVLAESDRSFDLEEIDKSQFKIKGLKPEDSDQGGEGQVLHPLYTTYLDILYE